MNKLIKLARLLGSLGLNKELAQLVHMTKIAQAEDDMSSLEPYSIPRIELEYFGLSSGVISKLKELGIILLSYISSGQFGNVFSGVYSGKPVVIKIAIGSATGINNDVENWNEIKNKIDSFPDFVKVLFPKIFLAYKDKDNNGNDFQILVVEKLRSIPKELSSVIKGNSWSLVAENLIEKSYPDIKMTADSLDLSFPPLRKILPLVKDNKIGLYLGDFLSDHLMSIIPTEEIELDDQPPVQGHNEVYWELIQKIEQFSEDLKDIWTDPMPTYGGRQFGGNERLWDAHGGLENFWKGISWLRDSGYSVSDLNSNNIMMDDAGNLKISDLGGFNY